jgi:hypothetical protein
LSSEALEVAGAPRVTGLKAFQALPSHLTLAAMSERAGSSVTEVAASYSVFVSQPQAVASLIKEAAAAV